MHLNSLGFNSATVLLMREIFIHQSLFLSSQFGRSFALTYKKISISLIPV